MKRKTLNIQSIKNEHLKNAETQVQDVALKVLMDARLFSPVDTGTYASNHRYEGITRQHSTVTATVSNETMYSERVEGGFRSKPVNWNLRYMGTTYKSVGANVYKRAIEKNRQYLFT